MSEPIVYYELDDPDDLKKISFLLKSLGIHLEINLFGQFYITLDKKLMNHFKKKEASKNVKKSHQHLHA